MSKKYHRFTNRSDALALADAIRSLPNWPIVGNKLGVPNPGLGNVIRFSLSPLDCNDGLHAFPEVDDDIFDELGVSQVDRDSIRANYITAPGAVLEDIQPSWKPDDDSYTEIVSTSVLTAKSEDGGNIAEHVRDGNPHTYWQGQPGIQWLLIEPPSPVTPLRFAISANSDQSALPVATGFAKDFVLQGSQNAAVFTTLVDLNDEVFSPLERVDYTVEVDPGGPWNFLRLQINNAAAGANARLSDWKVFI